MNDIAVTVSVFTSNWGRTECLAQSKPIMPLINGLTPGLN